MWCVILYRSSLIPKKINRFQLKHKTGHQDTFSVFTQVIMLLKDWFIYTIANFLFSKYFQKKKNGLLYLTSCDENVLNV